MMRMHSWYGQTRVAVWFGAPLFYSLQVIGREDLAVGFGDNPGL